jgi:hypothetical protein
MKSYLSRSMSSEWCDLGPSFLVMQRTCSRRCEGPNVRATQAQRLKQHFNQKTFAKVGYLARYRVSGALATGPYIWTPELAQGFYVLHTIYPSYHVSVTSRCCFASQPTLRSSPWRSACPMLRLVAWRNPVRMTIAAALGTAGWRVHSNITQCDLELT